MAEQTPETPVKKRRGGRPKGSKNKPKVNMSLEARKSLTEMSSSAVRSAHEILMAPANAKIEPQTKLDQLLLHTFEVAMDATNRNSHHAMKLLIERFIPQRKQVEHLGDFDSQSSGIDININMMESQNGENNGVTIEHEPVGGRESDGRDVSLREGADKPH